MDQKASTNSEIDPESSRNLIREVIDEYFGLSKMPNDGADLTRIAKFSSAIDSANYMTSHMSTCVRYPHALDLLTAGMNARRIEGLTLEFGVYSGQTLNHIASLTEEKVYGFDSFEGLPEDWRSDVPKGAFKRSDIPELIENAELVIGWFENTLPKFAKQHSGKVSLLHVDCDLYTSTKTIFYYLQEKIVRGTVIVFDEYFNYVGWRAHEYKAFQEFISSSGLNYEYIGVVPRHQQVAVQIV